MNKHLVLAGGGHAHLMTLARLDDFTRAGHRVTLISPSRYHYYSGMGPGMLSGIYKPEETRFDIRKMAEDRGGYFMEGRVTGIEPRARLLHLDSGISLNYDVVSFNIGSEIDPKAAGEKAGFVLPVKPIVNLLTARRRILDLLSRSRPAILVAGGGPAGVEIAGNTWRLARDAGGEADITIISRNRLLSAFPEKARRLAMKSLTGRRIKVEEGSALASFSGGEAAVSDGRRIPFDLLFLSTGIKPPSLFGDSGMATAHDGGLLVNNFLQSVEHPEIFGGGDCVTLEGMDLDRVGVYAVRQNALLYRNLLAAVRGGPAAPFDPGGAYMLIFNMGDGRGILKWRGLVIGGRLSLMIKNHIDRNFMKTYQVSGELTRSER